MESATTPNPETSVGGSGPGSETTCPVKAARDTAVSGAMLCMAVIIVVPSWPTTIAVAIIATMITVVCLRLLKHE